MRSTDIFNVLLMLLSCRLAQCMHIYLKSGEIKCYYEHLDKGELLAANFDTVVEQDDGTFQKDDLVTLSITIDETFDNNHRVLAQKAVPQGPFSFSAVEKGEHKICLEPYYPDSTRRIKLYHAIDIGSAISLQSRRNSAMVSLKDRIYQLNERLLSIKNEQDDIKKKEAVFREMTEVTNESVTYWSILLTVVLVVTCFFQLRYLKTLFIKQKQT
ncbi:Erp5p [Kluyveromyces lactis]|uniref:KLLA0E21385p n=1 Tax=Kluyveromyces lactis (strain ATCC 8585 / CBS 2359 / DSM 70799 / NBRC 1267 / NRRL Y-1140 / WM37) TaxID=284590 RepID=Q6CMC1_KLULA|nr:uncharacterized protein KLLA0_E21385g [Kluyveromyces lactis]CAH00005.1 KLLA0E21385p [Kluyveromyces lactis]|eukprot:XP_454918.1 uncharacterized protein KLLA0_E21385g [Kluyveromyces lactis]